MPPLAVRVIVTETVLVVAVEPALSVTVQRKEAVRVSPEELRLVARNVVVALDEDTAVIVSPETLAHE